MILLSVKVLKIILNRKNTRELLSLMLMPVKLLYTLALQINLCNLLKKDFKCWLIRNKAISPSLCLRFFSYPSLHLHLFSLICVPEIIHPEIEKYCQDV